MRGRPRRSRWSVLRPYMSTVLVVDDDRTVTHLVERSLSDGPISVLTAQTAEEGLSLVRSAHPDVVLLDIMLPGDVRAGGLPPDPGDRPPRAGDLHHRRGRQRNGHRGDEARRVRLRRQAARCRPAADLVAKALETRRLMNVPVALPISSNDGAIRRPVRRPQPRRCWRSSRRSAASPGRTSPC